MMKATATGASNSGKVTANVNGVGTTINVRSGLTVASGNVLLVEQVGSEWWAMAVAYGTNPTDPGAPAAPPPTSPVTGTTTFSPVETRSYRKGSWRTDNDSVYQGQYDGNGNHTGCVFYGKGPKSLAGATILGATIQVQRMHGGVYAAQTATMWLMTQATRPAGAPTLTSSATGPSLAVDTTNNKFAVPTSWVQSIVDGTAGGIAFFDSDGSPYIRFTGKGDWSPSFTMTISWRR